MTRRQVGKVETQSPEHLDGPEAEVKRGLPDAHETGQGVQVPLRNQDGRAVAAPVARGEEVEILLQKEALVKLWELRGQRSLDTDLLARPAEADALGRDKSLHPLSSLGELRCGVLQVLAVLNIEPVELVHYRRGALLHDIGKAVDHEVPGTHVEIGRRILQKFGVDELVIKAMQAHHEEYPYETPESIIVQVADAISAGRPGARRDTVERYLERLGDLERIAGTFPGVEKVYAIAAGREIRIFVNPGKVTDLAMHTLARSIAKRIQDELKYPGEIKVNIIRENRVVEFAR